MSLGCRIRLPVWTDARSQKRYAAVVTEVGADVSSVTLVGDTEAKRVRMPTDEYLALPYFYFVCAEPAPRPC